MLLVHSECLCGNNVTGPKIISGVLQVEGLSLCFRVKGKKVVVGNKLKGFPVKSNESTL